MATVLDAPPTIKRPEFWHGPFAACWAIVVLAAAGLVLTLQPVWASKPELADRFLIPATSAWLIYRSLPRMRGVAAVPSWVGLPLVILGAAAFALGWYLIVRVNARPLLLWWLTAAFGVTAVGVMTCHQGWARARLLIFPLAFCLFSLPTPNRIYWPLQAVLKEATTQSAVTVLPWLGISVARSADMGYVLALPSGDLGVAEACSGVRSVTALFAIAVLAAYLRGFSIVRGAILVALTLGVVIASNAFRVIVSGVLQELFGKAAIEGVAHEVLGVSVILVGLGLIVLISGWMKPRAVSVAEPGPIIDTPPGVAGWPCAAILLAAAAACGWSEQFRQEHRELIRLEELPLKLGDWAGEDLTIPDAVKEMLVCDQIIYRAYTNPLGQDVHVWVMFWANAGTTAHMHHPDICYPWRGWVVNKAGTRPVPLGAGKLDVSVRHYTKPDQQQILYFWTQSGRKVMGDGLEAPETMSGHSWIIPLLTEGKRPIEVGGRISVLMGTETRGDAAAGEKLLANFCQHLAKNLYERCPWAAPE